MKTTFLKSIASGIAVLALTSACSMLGAKDGAHKCGGKNSCKGKKSSKHSCSGNKCSSKKK